MNGLESHEGGGINRTLGQFVCGIKSAVAQGQL